MSGIGFVGGGNMAGAIMRGLSEEHPAADMAVCDPDRSVRRRHEAAGRRVVERIADLAGEETVVLAIKPQVLPDVAAELADLLGPEQLLVSILAGVTTRHLAAAVGGDRRIVRAMPNLPMAVGRGMVGLCAGAAAGQDDMDRAAALFAASAAVLELDEGRMDALTAVSGSGPAYVFYLAEALHEAAVQQGFTADEAALLVGRTLEGATAYLLSREGFPAAELRRQVTSPGGTTAAAVAVFEDRDLRATVAAAVAAAAARSRELAGGKPER